MKMETLKPSAALVTASYAPDFERCRLLCETVDQYVTGFSHHYILVEHNDVAQFRALESARTKRLQLSRASRWDVVQTDHRDRH